MNRTTIQEVRNFSLTKPKNLDAIDKKDVLDNEKSAFCEAILLDFAGGASRVILGASRQSLKICDFVGENTVL